MAAPEWSFGVLGPLSVEHAGTPIEITGRKPRTVLAALLMDRGRPVSPEALTYALWGDAAPATAQAAMHMHVSKLRTLLGDLLQRTVGGYQLAEHGYSLDADHFEQLVADAVAEPEHAGPRLHDALALWRGVPLADVELHGELADWQRLLQEQRLRATVLRIDRDLDAGASSDVIAELQRLIASAPYDERLRAQLMLALYRCGRHADALDAYGRIRRLLADELGLDPGAELRRLHQQVLDRNPGLEVTATAPASPAPVSAPAPTLTPPTTGRPRPDSRRVALPHPATRLIGRDDALVELENVASDPFCRLLTLTGTGGVGKTRLAIALAARIADQFSDGVIFVGLAALTDASQVRAEIAADLARRLGGREPNELSLMSYLTERNLLLVLDNFEHVLDASEVVAELLESAPGVRVIVTSRTPLRLRAEQRVHVEPLGTGLETREPGPAVELFLEGARARDRAYAPDREELELIAEICEALDGLPLAIELAAARASALSTSEIAQQLDEPLSIAVGDLRDLPARQQTVDAAIRWSYDLLSAPAQALLRAASAFAGPFTLAALGQVAGGEDTQAVYELTDASLLQRSAVADRFRLLRLVRAFTHDRLAESGEAEAAGARHIAYLRDRYADAVDAPPTRFAELAVEMAPDHADLRLAITNALSMGDATSAVLLAKALEPIWMVGQLEESGTIVDSIIDSGPVEPAEELALLRLAALANGYRSSNDHWARRRATRAAELGDVLSRVGALTMLAVNAMNRRDVSAATEIGAELSGVMAAHPDLDSRYRGVALNSLAKCAYLQGDFATAARSSTQALETVLDHVNPQVVVALRGFELLARSADEGWIAVTPVLEIVNESLLIQLPSLAVDALLPAARFAAAFDPAPARTWLASAERATIDLGGVMNDEWQDETLSLLGLDDITGLLESEPVRPIFEVLEEARDWLAARDPGERVRRSAVRVGRPAPLP